ncbi:DUF485 domain-containing protein [bacterium]|nr:DUF485 domain-containing protein [bacterium]
MLHKPAVSAKSDLAIAFKTRIGIYIFLAYTAVYIGFVAVNLMAPTLMAKNIMFGLNLAVVYGFGLIIVALILALIYNHLCARREKQVN